MKQKFFRRRGMCVCALPLLGGLCAATTGRSLAAGIAEYAVTNSLGVPSYGCDPEYITLGPDNAYWFSEFNYNKIGRIDTNGVVTEFIIPSGARPYAIAPGPDGALWFTEPNNAQIGRITTNGVVTEFPTLSGTIATGLATGADGRLWVLDLGPLTFPIGAPTNGGVMAFGVGTNALTSTNYYNTGLTVHSRPSNITAGPDGALWFTEQLAGKIGRISTAGVITESALLPANCKPYGITTGPDGALWFTEFGSNRVGRIDTGFNFTDFALPVSPSGSLDQPYGIMKANDGTLWYGDAAAGFVGQITLAGTNIGVGLFFTPTTNSFPRMLATGPDGNIWFGEYQNGFPGSFVNNIGRVIALPPLTIQNLGNFNFVLSWPTNATTNFVLQSNGSINTTNWTTVTNIPAVVGANYVVTNNANTNAFFRLINIY